MEDGNSIATDKNGRMYRLNHENREETDEFFQSPKFYLMVRRKKEKTSEKLTAPAFSPISRAGAGLCRGPSYGE